MESMNDRLAPQSNYHRQNYGAHDQRVVHMMASVSEINSPNTQNALSRTDVEEPATGINPHPDIILIIQDNVRRYGVEGMLRTADMGLSVKSIDNAADFPQFADCQLIISSKTTSAPISTDVEACLRSKPTRVLILMDPADTVDHTWADCADGFIDWSDLCPASLGQALTDIASGRLYVSQTLARRCVTISAASADTTAPNSASTIAVTPREHQVLCLLAEGLSNRQIAASLGISEHGVKRAVGIILAKLNCPNRTLAVVKAIELGLIDMDM